MGGIRELVDPGFLTKSRGDGWPMVVVRHEHDPKLSLGSIAGGTLQMTVDSTGLNYPVEVPESRSDVWELAQRGDLPGSSFSFQAFQDSRQMGYDGMLERHLISGRLLDVSTTAQPAGLDATVKTSYRSLAMWADADPNDVVALERQGELRSLFLRTDQHVMAPATVEPGGEYRSEEPSSAAQRELELLRKLSDDRAKRYEIDTRGGELDLYRRRNRLRLRELQMDERFTEARPQ
jgi:phage head maturation protease